MASYLLHLGFPIAPDPIGLPVGVAGYSPHLSIGPVAILLVPSRSASISCPGSPCLLVVAPEVAVLMAQGR